MFKVITNNLEESILVTSQRGAELANDSFLNKFSDIVEERTEERLHESSAPEARSMLEKVKESIKGMMCPYICPEDLQQVPKSKAL